MSLYETEKAKQLLLKQLLNVRGEDARIKGLCDGVTGHLCTESTLPVPVGAQLPYFRSSSLPMALEQKWKLALPPAGDSDEAPSLLIGTMWGADQWMEHFFLCLSL